MDSFSWIRTRDGSPTLFHNEEGAAFRSQNGAFTESYHVFVKPALEFCTTQSTNKAQNESLKVLEFGLGPGTNWLLWSLLSKNFEYHVIEKDLRSFELGFDHWMNAAPEIAAMISKATSLNIQLAPEEIKEQLISSKERLKIFASLEDCLAHSHNTSTPNNLYDLCFFDPFGFDVNPEAYSVESLAKLKCVMNPQSRIFSYACNSRFQKSLKDSGFDLVTPFSGSAQLKRERIEFWPKED